MTILFIAPVFFSFYKALGEPEGPGNGGDIKIWQQKPELRQLRAGNDG